MAIKDRRTRLLRDLDEFRNNAYFDKLNLDRPGGSIPAAWFLGPKAENADFLREMIGLALENAIETRKEYGKGDPEIPSVLELEGKGLKAGTDLFRERFAEVLQFLKGSIPMSSYRNQSHMYWDTTLPSVVGYFATMLFNENNGNDDPQARTLRTTLEVDGEERASVEGPDLQETVSFDVPGVHTIVTRGLNADGQLEQRRVRVLVSQNIPPVTAILEPQSGEIFADGDEITVRAETVPAFERAISEVTLHVKDNDLIAMGTNLVNQEAYPAVDRSEGPGPHELTFVPEEPGRYMVQVGARDDEGNLGVSGHVMLMITE